MTAHVIDGKARAEALKAEVRARVDGPGRGRDAGAGLAVVLVGENAASEVYVRNKRRSCEEVGMVSLRARSAGDRQRGRVARAAAQAQR